MPRESLDAPEDFPKEALCQVAFGQLQDEVPGMADDLPLSCPGLGGYPVTRLVGSVSTYIVVFCAAIRRSSSLTML